MYADEADAHGNTDVGDALRTRTAMHEVCEHLAQGGFRTLAFQSLCKKVEEIDSKILGNWPNSAEKHILKRTVKE